MVKKFSLKPLYFDRQGNEIDLLTWSLKCEDNDYKIVKQEYIGKYFISTVWIGLDISLFSEINKKIFETMIFIEEGTDEEKDRNELNLYVRRYGTEEEALMGHEEIKEMVKSFIIDEEKNGPVAQ